MKSFISFNEDNIATKQAANNLIEENKNEQADPPNILIMRRKSIRMFPNNQRVSLYYVDKINKYVTVPYTSMQWSESVNQEENLVDYLHYVLENQEVGFINFKDQDFVEINKKTSQLLLSLLDELSEENKDKVIDKLCENKTNFGEVLNFANKNLK